MASALLFAALGGAIGWALGTLAPNYYRNLYEDGHLPNFGPQQVGLGVTQGFTGGIVGLGIVLILFWRSSLDRHLGFGEPIKP